MKYEKYSKHGRFELSIIKNQFEIIDHKQSQKEGCIVIYNDLGSAYFSSAPQLCDLLNEQEKDLEQLLCDIVEILDYIEDNDGVTANEMRNYIKENKKHLRIYDEV